LVAADPATNWKGVILMAIAAFSDAVDAAADEMSVEIADSPEQILEAQRLRYAVYCLERGFEPGADGLEQDAFDSASHHVLVRSKENGLVYGTVRLVLAKPGMGRDSFPMQRVCEDFVLAPVPPAATGEISRFALTRDRRGISAAAGAMMRLFLMRGIVQVSGEHDLTHWCAIMESSLLRLLRATAIHFQPVGLPVEHHGLRQPAIGVISAVLDRIRREKPVVWTFITDNGALWQERGHLQQGNAMA
jgi:N-acyl-L-homoserine lactone synthetase